jgi:hypothetical protein
MVKKHHGLAGSKARVRWRISLLKGTPAKFLGYIEAPDEFYLRFQGGNAGEIAAGPIQAGDKSNFDRIGSYNEHDRNRLVAAFAAVEHVHLPANEVGRHLRQTIIARFLCFLSVS